MVERNIRILYFDIDGVLLSYEDEQRPLLTGGALQDRLKEFGFTVWFVSAGGQIW
jgi:hypothetical protein